MDRDHAVPRRRPLMRRPWWLRPPPAMYFLQFGFTLGVWISFLSFGGNGGWWQVVLMFAIVLSVLVGQPLYLVSRLRGEIYLDDNEAHRMLFGTSGWYTVIVVAATIGITVGGYSFIYLWLSQASKDCFGSVLTKLDIVYFTLTTLSTVGYGDVAPKSQLCRAVVSTQLLVSMGFLAIFFGLLVAVLVAQRASSHD